MRAKIRPVRACVPRVRRAFVQYDEVRRREPLGQASRQIVSGDGQCRTHTVRVSHVLTRFTIFGLQVFGNVNTLCQDENQREGIAPNLEVDPLLGRVEVSDIAV